MQAPDEVRDLSGLSPWADQLANTLVSLSSDIALVVDGDGVITNVAQNRAEPMAPAASHWIGQAWVDTVSSETRRKIELLLDEVSRTGLARRREVNHTGSGGAGIPVAYTAVRLGLHGPVLAVGRDLRAVAAIQQRFVDTQQELERVYWQARQADARDLRLHQLASDGVLVVDAQALIVLLDNDAAAQVLSRDGKSLAGDAVAAMFDAYSRGPVEELLVTARGNGRAGEIRARLAGGHQAISVSATPFRCGESQRLIVRLRPLQSQEEASATAANRAESLARTGVAITDSSGRLQACSVGLCALLGLAGEAALKGQALADWAQDSQGQWAEFIARVRGEGLAERTRLTLRTRDNAEVPVFASASLLTEGDQECVGLKIERASNPAESTAANGDALSALLERFELPLGSAALPQLLRRLCELAERHLIDAALARSAGNLQAAADVLGLSRDGLGRRVRKVRRSGKQALPPL